MQGSMKIYLRKLIDLPTEVSDSQKAHVGRLIGETVWNHLSMLEPGVLCRDIALR